MNIFINMNIICSLNYIFRNGAGSIGILCDVKALMPYPNESSETFISDYAFTWQQSGSHE